LFQSIQINNHPESDEIILLINHYSTNGIDLKILKVSTPRTSRQSAPTEHRIYLLEEWTQKCD